MGLSKEDYYRSALERLNQARQIYDDGHLAHALAVYIAGLSVECMLRAFIMRRTSELNEGHNLQSLFVESRLASPTTKNRSITQSQSDRLEDQRLRSFNAINDLQVVWSNQLRYASEQRFKRSLERKGKLHRLKGDAVRANSRLAIEAATMIITLGAQEWTRSSKS